MRGWGDDWDEDGRFLPHRSPYWGVRVEFFRRLARAVKGWLEARRLKRNPPVDPYAGLPEVSGEGRPPDEAWGLAVARKTAPDSWLTPGFEPWAVFDRESGCAIYAKTLDTLDYTYIKDRRRIYVDIIRCVDAIGGYPFSLHWKKSNLSPDDITRQRLDLAVPYQTSVDQWAAIHRATIHGMKRGVAIHTTRLF